MSPQQAELLKPDGEAALVKRAPEQLGLTPSDLVSIVVQRGGSVEELGKLLDLQTRWEAGESKKAFVRAMADFKAETIIITKDKENKQYGSRYTTLGNLVNTVTPVLSRHGLSVRWDIDQTSGIKVTCIITHDQGHSESVSMTCPPDKSGAKNLIQEIKSAITYAKSCTFESICGLASTDANLDDDGNTAARMEGVDDYLKKIATSPTHDDLTQLFNIAFTKAKDAEDKDAMLAIVKAKDARKRELNKARQ